MICTFGAQQLLAQPTRLPAHTQVGLIQWIESDNAVRRKEQLIDEAMRELGFQRRGEKIVAAIEQRSTRRSMRTKRLGEGDCRGSRMKRWPHEFHG